MQNKLIKQATASLVIVASLVGCQPTEDTNNVGGSLSNANRDWTYMVYMGADNSLSEAGLTDLIEMETVGSTDKVSIVVQAEFSPDNSQSVGIDTLRLLVEKDADSQTVNLKNAQSIGNVNMADSQVMSDFIKWAAQTYPAKNYALVVWDHGGGWKSSRFLRADARGAVEDATSDDFLSLPELANGVRNSGVHFGVIDFDACLMGMYEVAYEYLGLTDFMVFSEETVPNPGNPYSTLLAGLIANPTLTAEGLALLSVEQFMAFYQQAGEGSTNRSAIDMTMVEALHKKIREFTTALTKETGYVGLIQGAGQNTQAYAFETNHDLFDVVDYLDKALPSGDAKTLAGELKGLITNTVIINKVDSQENSEDLSHSGGIAIYLPLADQTTIGELEQYAELAINKEQDGAWGTFLKTYLAASGVSTDAANTDGGIGGFGALLTWEGCEADLDLYIYEPTSDGEGMLYMSWLDETTPNGAFTIEKDAESYVANESVTKGEYTVMVNVFEIAKGCEKLEAHLSVIDPQNGITQWTELSTANGFNIDSPSPQVMSINESENTEGVESLTELDALSDWWVPVSITRSLDEIAIESALDIEFVKNKRSQLIIQNGRDGRL